MNLATPVTAAYAVREGDDVVASRGLLSFWRYTYWSLVATSIGLSVLITLTGGVPFPPAPVGVVAFVALAVFAGATTRLTRHVLPRPPEVEGLGTAELVVWGAGGVVASVVLAATWIVGSDGLFWTFPPAMAASLLVVRLPRQRRRLAVTATLVAIAVAGIILAETLPEPEAGAISVTGIIVGSFVIGVTLISVWTWDVVAQLDRARRTAADLAVANERLRFAADLHDIQGHHLQVIALKSELATRLVTDDPDTAAREIADVERLAGDALRDTRAVVEGYRRATLDAELANAASVLDSAGIDTQLNLDADVGIDELPDTCRHLFGLVVREAVTNVLRHSAATRAEVSLDRDDGQLRLAVTNDGVDRDPPGPGRGLAALASRLEEAGGTLTWERQGPRFEVRAGCPVDAP